MRGWIHALRSMTPKAALSMTKASTLVLILTACGTNGYQPNMIPKPVDAGAPETGAAAPVTPSPETAPGTLPETAPESELALIERYQKRYSKLTDTHTKLVDNKGNGYDALYGTRNLRAILNGVVYRGGANNVNNRYGKRDNRNPLPNVGVESLCKEGFSNAVYLYSTNFDKAPKSWACDSFHNEGNKLTYAHTSPYNESGIKSMFTKIMTTIKNPSVGPTYLHCWNGWHASGLISALILRQFCNYSGDAAVAYWDLNTDGSNTDPAFKKIRAQIRAFKPYPEFKINAATQAAICAGN